MNTYVGHLYNYKTSCEVLVDGRPLPQRQDLHNHSPDGLAWGYGGSGPAQLALALLAYEHGDEFALKHYQDFKRQVVAVLPQDEGWTLTSADLERLFETI